MSARPLTGERVWDDKRNTLLLQLSEYPVAPRVRAAAAQDGYDPKAEYHLTIIGSGPLAKALKGAAEEVRARVEEEAAALAWAIVPTGRFLVLEKQYDGEVAPRESIIELVDAPAMAQFYETVAQMFPELGGDVPPPHVTVETKGNPHGIGVKTAGELDAISRPYRDVVRRLRPPKEVRRER